MTTGGVTRGTGVLEGFLAHQRVKMAEKLIPPGHRQGRVLDIGCGSYPLFLLQTEFHSKLGLDKVIDEGYARHAEGQDVEFIRHDFEQEGQLPVESDSCEVVTMLAVIEHIEPGLVLPLLQEVRRILKPRGICIVTTPSAWTDTLLRLMAKVRLVSPVEISEHKAAYTREQLASILSQVFPHDGVRSGFFELFMNLWAVARK